MEVISSQDRTIAQFYRTHPGMTYMTVGKIYGVSKTTVQKSVAKCLLVESIPPPIEWDPNELDGELNAEHDFRNLITYIECQH